MERTLFFIKPDAVERRAIGDIIGRVERAGLRIVALEMRPIGDQLAREHYVEHAGRPYFDELIRFITSGPVVAMVLEGEGAVAKVRQLMGATDPARAAPGSIRADLGTDITRNAVHGSDSGYSAFRELMLFFPGYEQE